MDLEILLQDQNSLLKSRHFAHDGAWGGATGGLICSLLVISMKWLGYSDLPMTEYVKLWPRIFFFGTAGGAFGGWLACRFASSLNRVKLTSKKRRLYEAIIFASGFLVLLIPHQLSVRDALRKPGSFEVIDILGNLDIVGGLFGEPNFKTVAAGLFGGASFLILVRGLSNLGSSKSEIDWKVALKATIVGGTFWSLVYVLFRALTEFGVLELNLRYPQDRTLSAVFVLAFRDPEHLIHFVIGCFIYVYFAMHWTLLRNIKAEKVKLSKVDQEFLDKVVSIIEENMGDMDFGPVQLAQKTGYDIRSLNRKVNNLTGTNTTLCMRRLRLRRAVHLIEENSGNITAICYEVGFRSLSYFEKSFKEHFGLTPNDYKKKHRMSIQ